MNIKYDKQADAMRISFLDSGYEISEEVDSGIIIDKTKEGKIMAIEILDVSEKFSKEALTTINQ